MEAEPTTHMARQDKPAELKPAGMAETAMAHPQAPEVEVEEVTPTARQHRLADTVETAMTPPSALAVA